MIKIMSASKKRFPIDCDVKYGSRNIEQSRVFLNDFVERFRGDGNGAELDVADVVGRLAGHQEVGRSCVSQVRFMLR